MKLAVLTCGILPVPAVQGGAVENLIDFYLEYNDREKLHDITVYSPWDARMASHPALASSVNHYHLVDVTSPKARFCRRLRKYLHRREYYNYFIEYYFERVYAHLRRQHYDIILLENCPGYALKLSRRGYRNLVLHLHNDLLNATSRHHDAIAGSLTKVLTVSDYIRQRVATIMPPDKIQTVHNGIDLQRFSRVESSAVSRQTLGFADDDFVLVYSGRINKDKGVSELIDALLLLADQPKIKLMILGGSFFGNTHADDDFIRSLKQKAEGIRQRIVFTGFIPYHDVPAYLQLADVAVIPSIWNDPFPTTELEAQAMALPIITTRRGGIPEEVTDDNAILLEPSDADFVPRLADAISLLSANPVLCRRMSEASLRRSTLFDKTTFAHSLLSAL